LAQREIVKAIRFRKQPEGFDANKLADLLAEAYLEQRRETKFTQKTTFSPSSIGYGKATCARYWYFAFTGAIFDETATDAMGVANMSNGSSAHERIETLFEEAGLLVAKELEITLEDPPVRGFADLVINWEGEEVIGEIKTTRQEMFLHRQATMKPAIYHLYQVLLYLKATGKKVGFLLYENKNSQEFLVIPVEMNPQNEKILNDALEWMRLVRKTWEDGEVPNRGFPTARNKNCRECPVRAACYADDAPEATVTIPLMETPRL
jgi:CRISPR/Cas system-associated exonuclease Cas4 (RecB family)